MFKYIVLVSYNFRHKYLIARNQSEVFLSPMSLSCYLSSIQWVTWNLNLFMTGLLRFFNYDNKIEMSEKGISCFIHIFKYLLWVLRVIVKNLFDWYCFWIINKRLCHLKNSFDFRISIHSLKGDKCLPNDTQ